MSYWFFLLFFSCCLALSVYILFCSRQKDNMEIDTNVVILSIALSLLLTLYFAVDIPSVLNGGQKMYVNKFPDIVQLDHSQLVYANGQSFTSLNKYNTAKYEQDAEYCITYTMPTRKILKIEKITTE